MPVQTGTTVIRYGPVGATWAARTFALYFREAQATKIDTYINLAAGAGLGTRDPALVDNAVQTRVVKSRIRRRYPGGPTISVPGGTRQVVVGPDIKKGTWPGRPITLERPADGSPFDPEDADVPMTICQITLDGSFPDFYVFCQSANRLAFILRTNHGRPIFIA